MYFIRTACTTHVPLDSYNQASFIPLLLQWASRVPLHHSFLLDHLQIRQPMRLCLDILLCQTNKHSGVSNAFTSRRIKKSSSTMTRKEMAAFSPLFGLHFTVASSSVPLHTARISSSSGDVMYRLLPQSPQKCRNTGVPESVAASR